MRDNPSSSLRISLTCFILLCAAWCQAQTQAGDSIKDATPRVIAGEDNGKAIPAEKAINPSGTLVFAGTGETAKKIKRDWNTWRPDAKQAMWLAVVLPGAGQIYNRKYWKLPIVYGGFVGCYYAMRWNNQMYHDYSQAYIDLMDNDPQSQSYNQFLHLGNKIDASNIERYKELFRKRKDRYRRWRDLSFFTLIGVYALSVIDAYVDASLSEFDISDDLTLRIEPAVVNSNMNRNPLASGGLGIHCSLNF